MKCFSFMINYCVANISAVVCLAKNNHISNAKGISKYKNSFHGLQYFVITVKNLTKKIPEFFALKESLMSNLCF